MLKFILGLMLSASFASAADTPVFSSYRDFSGGLNNFTASVSLPGNESPDLLNVVIDEPAGALAQRSGYATCGNTPSGNTATALYEYSKNNGARYLMVTDNVTIWQTADCISFSTVTTGWQDTYLPRFATVRDNLWIVNGSTWPYVWDGTTGYYLDGLSNRPTGPKGKLIAYWKSRVWIGNTPTQPSSLYFSSLVDDNGLILDPATSTGAWSNALNVIYFDRDDGSPLYGIKVYRDNMYAFKETGISRLLFESEYTANGTVVAKTASKTGSKFQESIVEMDDGFLRFVGRDGVYRFDGNTVQRISTKWTPTFYSIKQPSRAESYKLWDTDNDFLVGTLTNLTTEYVSGSLSLARSSPLLKTIDMFGDGNYTASPIWTPSGDNYFSVVTSSLAYVLSTATVTGALTKGGYVSTPSTYTKIGETTFNVGASVYNNYRANFTLHKNTASRMHFLSDSETPGATNGYAMGIDCDMADGAIAHCHSSLYKCAIGVCSAVATNVKALDFDPILNRPAFYTQECTGEKAVVTASSISLTGTGKWTLKQSYSGATTTGSNDPLCTLSYVTDTGALDKNKAMLIYGAWSYDTYGKTTAPPSGYNAYVSSIALKTTEYKLTGTFTSQVSTTTGLTQWKTFDTDQSLNNQTIAYRVRTAPTVGAVAAATYSNITPGTVLSTTTNSFFQWEAVVTTIDSAVSPLLSNASAGWITGDASKSTIVAVPYKSRYWMSSSTTTGNLYNDMVMVESKTPIMSYTKFNLPLSAMTIWNNNLYAAIGNTSKIARMDYGDTDDGAAITAYYDTPDDVYGYPVMHKTINRLIADYSSLPANSGLKIGLSDDMGNTWQYRTINTARYPLLLRDTIVLNMDTNRSLQFRGRIFNNTIGVGFKVYGLHGMGDASMFFSN